MMKNIFASLSFLFCLLFCLPTYAGGKKVMLKGNVINYTQTDSVELYDALGRQQAALEKSAVDKGSFRFTYNPVEIGYYVIHFANGKNVLCVLVPDQVIELEVDASNAMITSVKNSPENQLLHDYQVQMLAVEMVKDSLVRAHQEKPDPNIQQKLMELENRRGRGLAQLCWEHPDNYASGALLENRK